MNLFLTKLTKKYSLDWWAAHLALRSKKDEATGCVLWTAGRNSCGYPTAGKYPNQIAGHRAAYQVYHPDEDITDKVICHSCDTPNCIAKDHLIAATKAYNNFDKVIKGRSNTPKGTAHFNSKVSEAQVREIRDLYKRRVILKTIAEQYNISISTAQKIAVGTYYKNVV